MNFVDKDQIGDGDWMRMLADYYGQHVWRLGDRIGRRKDCYKS